MFSYIQVLATLISFFALASLLTSYRRGALSLRRLIGWFLLWLIVIVVVYHPAFSDTVAVFLGVSHGTDAAFFIAILLIFYVIFKLLMRIENLEQNLTKIVREIAFRNGNRSDKME